jgi:glyoxalase family protein
MKLEGIHHITAITADAPGNVDFYVGTMGLRMVKKTVNQDDPTIYHLFYADEKGSAGSDLTFFEYKGAPLGRAGAGMVHRIVWRVGSEEALDFWGKRIEATGLVVTRGDGWVRFPDPEGLELEVRLDASKDDPLIADHPQIPSELALRGFDGVRAYTTDPSRSEKLLTETLNFDKKSDGSYEVRGSKRGGFYEYDEAPAERGQTAAGTVHHIAYASPMDEHEAWHKQVGDAGVNPTPIIDRFYFRSIYFREPSGVLFELATLGPGFAVDEPADKLGESLSLPPDYKHLREQLEKVLTPLPNPRAA